jgi:hypothetical protein
MRHDGGLMIALGAALALAVSIYNYFAPVGFLAPTASINGTPGAALVIFSTAVLMVFGLVLAGRSWGRGLVWFVAISALLAILGTALAGWMLDSMILVALMLFCLVGWLMRLFTRHPRLA